MPVELVRSASANDDVDDEAAELSLPYRLEEIAGVVVLGVVPHVVFPSNQQWVS